MQSNSVTDLLYIHPEHRLFGKNDIVPMGAIGLMNSVNCVKRGVFMEEASADLIRKSKVVAMDVHWYFSMDSAFKAAVRIKRINPGAKIVAGGYTATVFAEKIVRDTGIDYVIRGDAEVPFGMLVERLLADGDASGVPNVVSKDFSSPQSFSLTTDVYDSIDYLTISWFPTLEKLALRYQRNAYPVTVYPFIPVFKGCIHDCEFCYGSPAMQRKLCGRGRVPRSPGRVREDMERLSADPRIRTIYMIMDFIESPGGDYAREIFSKKYDLNLYYEFFNYPSIDELDSALASFNHCFFYFPLVENHIGEKESSHFDKLREALEHLRGRNCSTVLWVNPTLASRKKDYGAAVLDMRKKFGVELMNGNSELIPVPGLDADPRRLDDEYREYLGKSAKRTAAGALMRALLPIVFSHSSLLLLSRKIYTLFFSFALRLSMIAHRTDRKK